MHNHVIANLLDQAGSLFSNHVCNDLEKYVVNELENLSEDDRHTLMADASEWNNGDIELDKPEDMPDWMLMKVLAFQLRKYA